MKLPRDLSGEDLADGLCRRWNYKKAHQVGSHIVLETELPSHQRISIPAHKHVNIGTLNNILRSVAAHKGVTREELLRSIL
jgi:predicted RNA binding protein YcfA (HicA-like mRNA interferase family)